MAKSALTQVAEIFEQSQFSVTSHGRLLKKSKQLYETMSENDFTKAFICCLQVPLIHGEKHGSVEDYMNYAYHEAKSVEDVEHCVKLQKQYIFIQLLELCKVFDLADEVGRTNLQNLCCYLLANNEVSEEVVPVVVELLVRVMPNVEERLQAIAELISEVRELNKTGQEPELEDAGPPADPIPTLIAEEMRQKELKQASIRVKINELKEKHVEAIRDCDFIRDRALTEEYLKLQLELKALTADVPSAPAPPSRAEVQDPFKDELVLRKCLRIVREMVQSESVQSLPAILRSLMSNFVLPCLHEDKSSVVQNKAWEALGLFCLLDQSLAQEHFPMFRSQIANDEVCEVALKVTFDLLLMYGEDPFQVQEENGETSTKKKSKKKNNHFVTDLFDDEFDTEEEESQESHINISRNSSGNTSNLISMLSSLVDSASASMRNLAGEGLCKLLMACRTTSSALLSRLILLYSSVTEGDEPFRHQFWLFLHYYASHCRRSQETLEQAFLPTMKTLMQAPITSPLTSVDEDGLASRFIALTKPHINKFHSKTNHIHNKMAISICNAIMDLDDSTNVRVLLRTLAGLELSLDDSVYREKLKSLTKMLIDMFKKSTEKELEDYVQKLSQHIEAAENVSIRTTGVENTAVADQIEGTETRMTISTTTSSENQTTSRHGKIHRLLDPDRDALTAENGNEDDEEDESSEKQPPCNSDIVIPARPPRSQPSDSKEDENSSEVGTERTRKRAKVSADKAVFKKPLARGNGRKVEAQDVNRNAAESGSDSSPVRTRKKASAQEKGMHRSDSAQPRKEHNI